jgi:hypothetical protein
VTSKREEEECARPCLVSGHPHRSLVRLWGVPKARHVITAVVVEGRSQAKVACPYGLSQSWISRLIARHRAEGEAAFEPRSRRPRSSPNPTPQPVVDRVLALSTRVLALELCERDITVNAVSLHVGGRCAPASVAAVVMYLLTADGHDLTGQIIRIDEPI